LEKNEANAVAQAKLFTWRLREVLSYEAIQPERGLQNLGLPYLPIAVDATLRPQLKYSRQDQMAFGIVYGATICAWIRETRRDPDFASQPIMLFTTAHIYRDYGLSRTSCNLDSLPIWISQHNRDGGLPQSFAASETKVAIAELCKIKESSSPSDVGRCRMHQYTSFGGFAAFQKSGELDLDRFYGDEQELRQMLQRATTLDNER
jgi:hypothetical protein